MQDLFNFPKKQVTKTNEKGKFLASKKTITKELRVSKRDDNFKMIITELNGFPDKNQYFAIKTNGTSDCGSIFTYALNTWDSIEEMYLATWTISNSHAKTFSISDKNGNFITVSGSANWSENPRIENFLILNDENLFNHHKDWMSELTDLV